MGLKSGARKEKVGVKSGEKRTVGQREKRGKKSGVKKWGEKSGAQSGRKEKWGEKKR